MSDYIAEVGDRVRVTIEGEVKRVNRFDTVQEIRIETEKGETLYFDTDEATVEKAEPPVEPEYVFSPGDVVVSKACGYRYTVGKNGYFDHLNNVVETDSTPFTSKQFERVV
jgi:hypothetical protein